MTEEKTRRQAERVKTMGIPTAGGSHGATRCAYLDGAKSNHDPAPRLVASAANVRATRSVPSNPSPSADSPVRNDSSTTIHRDRPGSCLCTFGDALDKALVDWIRRAAWDRLSCISAEKQDDIHEAAQLSMHAAVKRYGYNHAEVLAICKLTLERQAADTVKAEAAWLALSEEEREHAIEATPQDTRAVLVEMVRQAKA
jgi:hypothetical protein